jgi:hypothetical protein
MPEMGDKFQQRTSGCFFFCLRDIHRILLQLIKTLQLLKGSAFQAAERHRTLLQTALTLSSYIYAGVWTDWSYGSVIGARLTLSNHNAYFLVLFLTLFVRYLGQALWTIFCYYAFQAQSTQLPQDTLYYQLQATLRNSNGDTFMGIPQAWISQAEENNASPQMDTRPCCNYPASYPRICSCWYVRIKGSH